jgi:hypothetical protein
MVTTEAASDVDAFPVFFDIVEYQGLEYGMTWPGSYTAAFTCCSDLVIGDIMHPGDGVYHAWISCLDGPIAIPGWVWVEAQGRICVVPHPDGHIVVTHCGAFDTTHVEASFCAGIGGTAGDDPCP